MNKCYVEICYTYENYCKSFSPPVAIVAVEVKNGESIENLINKAANRIKEKYSHKMIYIISGRYLGNSLEILIP